MELQNLQEQTLQQIRVQSKISWLELQYFSKDIIKKMRRNLVIEKKEGHAYVTLQVAYIQQPICFSPWLVHNTY